MAEIGHYSLLIALFLALYSTIASFAGTRVPDLGESARRAALALFWLLTIAACTLVYLLAVRDLTVEYVARYTSTVLPMSYAVSAFWAGNAGSLLFWVWLLSAYAALVVRGTRKSPSRLVIPALGVMMLIALFFLGLILFLYRIDPEMTPGMVRDPFYATLQVLFGSPEGGLHPACNPFWRLPFRPAEGLGLNPQLQNPGMMFHPPTLYLGYVGMAVPYAFAMAALLTGRVGNEWLSLTRRWTLVAWFFLSIGNILGGWWAYVTLGWGGYWGWDPVENAAFIPWLLATAFLHSVIMQEKRGMFRTWNMVLVLITFVSTIFGTYLTRSGVISSVHAFARNEAFNIAFLAFMAVALVVSFALLFARRNQLASENPIEAVLSREAAFLFNNVVLVGIALVVLFGTVFPAISSAFTGVQVSMGPAWFNNVLWPLWAMLLLLTGVGPVISWRRARRNEFRRGFAIPFAVGIVVAAALVLAGMRNGYALAFFAICAFVLGTIAQEVFRAFRTRAVTLDAPPARKALVAAFTRNRRFGAYIVHLGVIIVAVGVTGSSLFERQSDLVLRQGEARPFEDHVFRYTSFRRAQEPNRDVYAAGVEVARAGEVRAKVEVVKEDYHAEQMRWTKARILSSVVEDVYLTLAAFQEDGSAITLSVRRIPLVVWLWIGGAVLVLGSLIAMLPDTRERVRRARPASRTGER
ncbi:MAG TPA: heme lyase CcmF/NrfE family subunit [Candidatus Latescibacteria bacterium]|nr:heme lyase CcmF/NrfE family subunit [Candidatus Latescibacterota bacterium]